MIFLIFGDIFAVWVFPLLLALMGTAVLHVYMALMGATPLAVTGFDIFPGMLLTIALFHLSFPIAATTAHLRQTPEDLLRYMARFAHLVLRIELFCVGLHFVVISGLSLVTGTYALPWADTMTTTVCSGLGLLIGESAASRTFLEMPLPEVAPEPVRGQELGTSDDISWKAWLDE